MGETQEQQRLAQWAELFSSQPVDFQAASCWTAAYDLVPVGEMHGEVVEMLLWISQSGAKYEF